MMENSLPIRMFGKVLSCNIRRNPLVRRSVKLVLDGLAAAIGISVAALLLRQRAPHLAGLAAFLVLSMAVNTGFKFFAQHYRVLGIEEARSLLLGNLVLVTAVMSVCLLRKTGWPGGEPPEVALGASLLTGPLWLGLRVICVARHQRDDTSAQAACDRQPRQRTLIVGAGGAGMLLCQALREHSRKRCAVLGFVDDAPEKQGVRIHGVPVGYFEPIHTQPYIRELFGDLLGTLPGTEGLAKRTLALPFHTSLCAAEIDHVLAVLKRNLR